MEMQDHSSFDTFPCVFFWGGGVFACAEAHQCFVLFILCYYSHLEDNQISVVERGAFQDLRLLERL